MPSSIVVGGVGWSRRATKSECETSTANRFAHPQRKTRRYHKERCEGTTKKDAKVPQRKTPRYHKERRLGTTKKDAKVPQKKAKVPETLFLAATFSA